MISEYRFGPELSSSPDAADWLRPPVHEIAKEDESVARRPLYFDQQFIELVQTPMYIPDNYAAAHADPFLKNCSTIFWQISSNALVSTWCGNGEAS